MFQQFGPIEQWVAHQPGQLKVAGSNPILSQFESKG